jgi:hypothetical protein
LAERAIPHSQLLKALIVILISTGLVYWLIGAAWQAGVASSFLPERVVTRTARLT